MIILVTSSFFFREACTRPLELLPEQHLLIDTTGQRKRIAALWLSTTFVYELQRFQDSTLATAWRANNNHVDSTRSPGVQSSVNAGAKDRDTSARARTACACVSRHHSARLSDQASSVKAVSAGPGRRYCAGVGSLRCECHGSAHRYLFKIEKGTGFCVLPR